MICRKCGEPIAHDHAINHIIGPLCEGCWERWQEEDESRARAWSDHDAGRDDD